MFSLLGFLVALCLIIFTVYFFLNGSNEIPVKQVPTKSDNTKVINESEKRNATAQEENPSVEDRTITEMSVVNEYTVSLDKNWVEATLCNIKHKKHVKMVTTYQEDYEPSKNTCTFGYNLDELICQTIPSELTVIVFSGYDGGSRREYYLSRRSYNDETSKYVGASEFVLNGEKWLKLNWEDAYANDDYYSPQVVYLKAKGSVLVAIIGSGQYGYIRFDDNVRKFLSSIEIN
ncbi:hypothetical protein A2982_03700 [candidate division WWE3 bacterium RIFCSPLOWO2_01_FULL_39_13]|uniref:Uncharacterized protein n=1 Tax=candidate division WWE3 bacterium RIFCSPLOWO2_01_FULL_39_13 TaxID=1802624 RepID=A0A1F4V5E0_UNCKA|nr:MAG: hypothetical protein A2982_03700 [candidate division WWE3 bacterium RIFCSPLOWO2_01_FULL_39_13]